MIREEGKERTPTLLGASKARRPEWRGVEVSAAGRGKR